jgi:hypothetical protein
MAARQLTLAELPCEQRELIQPFESFSLSTTRDDGAQSVDSLCGLVPCQP